jgi:hypothetical protein
MSKDKFTTLIIAVIAAVIISALSGTLSYDHGYKAGQLNAIRGEWTYFIIDGRVLKYIGQDTKEAQ